MIPVRQDQRLLLAALRDPPLAPSVFTLSLPYAAAERAASAFEGLVEVLNRYARIPWVCGNEDVGCSACEASLLRFLSALQTEDGFLAAALLQWLLRPQGRNALQQHAVALMQALSFRENRHAA